MLKGGAAMLTAFQLLAGIALLYAGAEMLVRGGASLALRVGITPLVVGLTVISFGTSSPELVVSFKAAMDHDSAIALGNVIGSNIANIALVLGLAALIRPIRVERQVIRREVPIMLLASVILCVMLWNGRLGRLEGGLLFAALIAYTIFSIRLSRAELRLSTPTGGTASVRSGDDTEVVPPLSPAHLHGGTGSVPSELGHDQDRDDTAVVPPVGNETPPKTYTTPWSAALIILGLVLLLPGAHIFVLGAVTVAEWLGVSAFVIGLTVVAIGTSLPEVATSMVASFKGEGDMAVGNAIGSNIFNIFCILGLSALFFGVAGNGVAWIDLGVMLGVALISLPILRTGFVIDRWEGAALLVAYAGYLFYRFQISGI